MERLRINDYDIVSVIGQGGMATVYLATDKKFHTEVALKILNREFVHNENIRKRFLAEARNMFRMNHPNVVRVTDLIDDGDSVAFVMEHVEGKNLKDYILSRGALPDSEIRNLFTQMLKAVGYVHEQGFVHRDIKPSNFIIDKKGKVKLLDFGIAKNTDAASSEYTMTGTAQQMGTPMYMSPEQIRSTKEVTSASDIYSLGVVLWQMVTGKKPYDCDTMSNYDLQTKIVNEALELTGTNYDELIQKATKKVVEERYKNCNDIVQYLEKGYRFAESTIFQPAFDKTHVEEYYHMPSANYNKPSKVSGRKVTISLIIVGVIALAGAIYLLLNKQVDNGGSDIIATGSPNDSLPSSQVVDYESVNQPADETTAAQPVQSEFSFLDVYGKLQYKSECYIIVEGAYMYESDARSKVQQLRQEGYSNAGYLWIPDYPSLSGKKNFATFLGPYHDLKSCKDDLRLFPKDEKFWYAKRVSMDPVAQEEIR